jgi:hypothetical protein
MLPAIEKVCVGSLVAEGPTAIIPRFMFWSRQKRFSQWSGFGIISKRAGSSRQIQLSLKVVY